MLSSALFLRLPVSLLSFLGSTLGFVLFGILFLLATPKVWAAAPYSLAQILAERRELSNLIAEDRVKSIQAIAARIAALKADPTGGVVSL